MPALKLFVQYATQDVDVPSRAQLRRWVLKSIRVDTEVTIRFVDHEEGQALNRGYRGKDYATNVLTFPLTEHPFLMGDIIICVPVVKNEATELLIPLEAHYAHLTVHGVLHLHGYDHEVEEQAQLMEALETEILCKLGYANPYLITQETVTPR